MLYDFWPSAEIEKTVHKLCTDAEKLSLYEIRKRLKQLRTELERLKKEEEELWKEDEKLFKELESF